MSDSGELALLRDSVRGFLVSNWPANGAPERHADGAALEAIWRGLASQGLTLLGADDAGGLAVAVVAMEELGRAACPIPLGDAYLANRTLEGDTLLASLHDGRARLAFAIDPAAGATSGEVAFVEAGAALTHVVVARGDALALVEVDGANVTPARALGLDSAFATIRSGDAPARPLHSRLSLDVVRELRRLLLLARAHGAARRAFELAVDYAKERVQFGRPIGSFQAIQHKLADGFIALEGTRLALDSAADAFDRGEADWRYFAAAACAFGGRALREVALQTQHTFGAIGYAEEHEAPRHFRRVHLDTLALGGAAAAIETLERHYFDAGRGLPRFDLGPDGNAMRDAVEAWLSAHWSGDRKAAFDAKPFHDREFDASFARDVGATGWIGLAWPREHGGAARTPIETIGFMEEMERAEAPRIGAAIQASALMLYGTPAQQARYLPEILRGEAMHGMGYSEPQAGSDLSAIKTEAVRDGDEWVITGQKIWTTTWWGRYMFLAARTDRNAKPAHAGLSMFIVPMDAPGITVRPAKTMYDGTFANIFYDGVRIPAGNLVGELNGGWKVLTGALATERGLVGGGIVLKVAHAFERLLAIVRTERGGDPKARAAIASIGAEIEVGRQLMLHCARLASDGPTPPEYGAISKVYSGELMERFGELALEILGLPGTLSQDAPGAIERGRFEQGLRHSLMWVISIGTNEIQRSLIAQRGLGLPR